MTYLYKIDHQKKTIIISLSEHCPLKCKYCYQDSIKSRNTFSELFYLNQLFLNSEIDLTSYFVYIGGLSDPFLDIDNDKLSNLLCELESIPNKIHISTKIKCGNDILETIRNNTNIHLSVSISTIMGEFDGGAQSVEQRFRLLECINSYGIPTSLYLRPIIPYITITGIPQILNILKSIQVNNVIIGSLYFNDSIQKKVGQKFVSSSQSKFILDEYNVLKKAYSLDYEEIRSMLEDENIHVFTSPRNMLIESGVTTASTW